MSHDSIFYRDQEERCRRLARACPTRDVSDELERLAEKYAGEAAAIEVEVAGEVGTEANSG